MRAQCCEALLDVRLDHVLEVDDAEQLSLPRDGQRRAAAAGNRVDRLAELRRPASSGSMPANLSTASTAPLRMLAVADVDAREPRLGGERHDGVGLDLRLLDAPKSPLASATIERPSGVSSPRLASRAASASSVSGRRRSTGMKVARHAVAEGDRAGLVEQQRIDVARRFDRTAGGGDDVEADQAVHAGDADRRQQAADGRRDQRDQQRGQHGDGEHGAANSRRGPTASRRRSERSASGRRAGSTARSRSASSGAPRLRSARSCGRRSSSPARR